MKCQNLLDFSSAEFDVACSFPARDSTRQKGSGLHLSSFIIYFTLFKASTQGIILRI